MKERYARPQRRQKPLFDTGLGREQWLSTAVILRRRKQAEDESPAGQEIELRDGDHETLVIRAVVCLQLLSCDTTSLVLHVKYLDSLQVAEQS